MTLTSAMGGPTGARWWTGEDLTETDQNFAGIADSKDPDQAVDPRVVELSADASNHAAERTEGNSSSTGKLKKSGSGFFKGLGRRRKSSGSIADEHLDANTQTAVDDGILRPVPIAVADEAAVERKKGVSSILHGLGRKKKSSGNLAELTEAAGSQAIEAPVAAERCD